MAEEQALVQLMDTLDGLELTKSEYEWLEQRFAAMTEKEQLLFRGAMKLEKPETASEAIDIAGQLHCYELFYSAGDEDALGQFGAVDKVCFQKYGLAKSLSNSIYLIVNNNKQARKTYLLFR